jgi:uncharacterized protein
MDKVVHFEIPADDLERARKFYKNVFKWEMQPMPDMNYTIVRTTEVDSQTRMPKEPGAINGGMPQRSETLKAPMVTIAVDSIDDTLKKIEKGGGKKLSPKQSIGDMGFIAYFKDPEGNTIGLWQMKPQ